MFKSRYILFALFVLLSSKSKAQYFDKIFDWRGNRVEYGLLAGTTNYNGDLGGANKPGTDWFLFDMELVTFRQSFGVFYRYNLNRRFANRLVFTYGKLMGDDKLTAYYPRNQRNLHFTSTIYDLSFCQEYHIIRPKPGHVYNIKGAKGFKNRRIGVYLFAGIGVVRFNPKAEGIALRNLHTEGQGLPGGPLKAYSRFALVVPFGMGINYKIVRNTFLGLDLSYRYTSTDYLDDVSTVYYDNAAIKSKYGEVAAYYADPSGTNNNFAGAQRGDSKHKDGYVVAHLSLTTRITHRNKAPSRSGGKHRFLRS